MKALLSFLFLFPLFVFSQQKDTTKLPTNIAKLVIHDLVSGDSCKDQLAVSNRIIKSTEQKVAVKDSVISVLNKKQVTYLQQIEAEQAKTLIWQQQYAQLQKENKKMLVRLRFQKVVSAIVVGGLTYLYINK